MLEASVEVSLSLQQHDVLEVRMVDVGINSEEPLEYHLDDVHEILREGNAESTREDLLVVQLIFNPSHQKLYVLTSRDL